MKNLIGQIGDIHISGLTITVEISDSRSRYGKTDLRVTPLSGSGAIWKEADNVRNIRPITNDMEPLLLSDDDEFEILADRDYYQTYGEL